MGCCDTNGMLPVEDAIQLMLSSVSPVNRIQTLPLQAALGFVLSDSVYSPCDVPPFNNSAMDGYAVRRSDLDISDTLSLCGKAYAGRPYEGHWPSGTCIRIMTGAPVPEACDAVIMQEKTEVIGDKIRFLTTQVKPQANIRPKGDDMQAGQEIFPAGTKLTVRHLPVLASLGICEVRVFEKPKVAFFSTGDELCPPGHPLKAGQIYDSNRYAIRPMLERFGCEAIDLGIMPDDPEQLTATFQQAQSEADVVITSGGVSVGEADYTKLVLKSLGEINFWKIAMKPGKPFAFGQLENALFCGLPGNPVSAVNTLHALVRPMLAKLSGWSQWQAEPQLPAITKSRLKKTPGRTDYQRGIYTIEDGQVCVGNAGNQSSGAFKAMSVANCFIILERERASVEPGETVQIQPFDTSLYY
ncbi:Molybdopterin molybdenumtransferase [Vibrio aerogenes CECT 7868]|uniref:Molybdopterin molybdenumtransferase n=1 Tax=Vibrio aerogenes CECT 7868 TaxID=1216006 RepID=A0A1M5ZKR2_9VIBR|nr:molybdopterin molybdotransferase MoeA [Vibrio aerogenes]SHI24786.1 Molybdopterin molybdenumtransferase [Vibrio aerogenes CECT 7868]